MARTVRKVENQRLVYYYVKPHIAFWDAHWKKGFSPKIYDRAQQGYLGKFEEPFMLYLPRSGRILEAGCGLGTKVLALRARGYEVEGVEWSSDTVETIHKYCPDLPVRVGDVTALEVPDHYYKAYISLGVIEHRQQGPEPFLTEAYRVLEHDGIALISVPHFHALRRLKGKLRLYRDHPNGLEFYQYGYTPAEMADILQTAGFEVIKKLSYGGFKGVKDELPFIQRMFKWPAIGWRLQKWLRSWNWAEANLGHMILFVCRKV